MMKKSIAFVMIGLPFFCFAACGQTKGQQESVDSIAKLCYIPIGVDTFEPMTLKNISDHCAYRANMDIGSKDYLAIVSLVKRAGPGHIEDGLVRVKISLSNSTTIYIDENGGAKVGDAQSQVNSSEFLKIKKILNRVVGIENR